MFNPDDLRMLGLSAPRMRAMCRPGLVKQIYKKKTVMGPSQEMIRDLTAQEVADQVHGTVGKIVASRNAMRVKLAAVHATWSNVDQLRLVKLHHGLPGVANGLAAATKVTGKPLGSWAEFRDLVTAGRVRFDPITEGYRGSDNFAHLFANAEFTTKGMA